MIVVHFSKLGHQKDLTFRFYDTDIYTWFAEFEHAVVDQGFVIRNLAYVWNPNNNGVNYITNNTSMGSNILGEFRIIQNVPAK